jgi:hypothetical protein
MLPRTCSSKLALENEPVIVDRYCFQQSAGGICYVSFRILLARRLRYDLLSNLLGKNEPAPSDHCRAIIGVASSGRS